MDPVLELFNASVIKADRRVLDGLTLTILAGEHTAIVGPNGAGKSLLVKLLTHEERALAPADDAPPVVRVFGTGNWNVFELRSQLGIVSADLHQRFVAGNSEGFITGEAAVLSGFLASDGILRYGLVSDEMLDAHAVIGHYDEIAAKLRARYGGLATSLEFAIPLADAGDEATLGRLIESLRRG